MAEPSPLKRFWLALRELPGRTPLRVKLITAVLTLVIIALAIISFAGRVVYGNYLQHQAEKQLAAYYEQVTAAINGEPHSRLFFPGDGLEQVWLLSPSGQQIQFPGSSLTPYSPPPQVPTSQSWLSANAGKAVTVPGQSGDNWLVVTQQIPNITVQNPSTGAYNVETVTLVVGYDLGNIQQEIGYLTGIDLAVSGAVIVILAIVGVAVVRASLRPLTDFERTAGSIAAGDLSRRVPDLDPRTEVGRLGKSLNAMLTQIEAAFDARAESEFAARRSEERMRQFVADASHELRTPLTAIRGYAEYYRQRGRVNEIEAGRDRPTLAGGNDGAPSPPVQTGFGPGAEGPLDRAEVDRIMQRVEQESSRMGVLVEDMLLLARLDQQRPLERGTVDMLTLAADAVNDARVIAPDRSINLTVGSGAALLVVGDEVRLRQVIGNLMSNALNHTPEGSPIEARVRLGDLDEWRVAAAQAGRAEIAWARRSARPTPAVVFEVADRGPGLTPDQASHVFERFYRGEKARTRKAGGTGLGLSIVAALVAAHDGAVWVESPPGDGATFHIAIPLAPEARYSSAEPDDGPDAGAGGPPGLAAAWRGSAHPRRTEAPAPRPFPPPPPPRLVPPAPPPPAPRGSSPRRRLRRPQE
jgi:two-component system, OmpR family, sensor kinase